MDTDNFTVYVEREVIYINNTKDVETNIQQKTNFEM